MRAASRDPGPPRICKPAAIRTDQQLSEEREKSALIAVHQSTLRPDRVRHRLCGPRVPSYGQYGGQIRDIVAEDPAGQVGEPHAMLVAPVVR